MGSSARSHLSVALVRRQAVRRLAGLVIRILRRPLEVGLASRGRGEAFSGHGGDLLDHHLGHLCRASNQGMSYVDWYSRRVVGTSEALTRVEQGTSPWRLKCAMTMCPTACLSACSWALSMWAIAITLEVRVVCESEVERPRMQWSVLSHGGGEAGAWDKQQGGCVHVP